MAETVCNLCYQGLIFASRFKQKCEQSIAKLQTQEQSYLDSENIKPEANNIKIKEFDSNPKKRRQNETWPIKHDEKPFKHKMRLRKSKPKAQRQQLNKRLPSKKIQSLLTKEYDNRPFECDICLRKFQLRGLLQQHVERHQSKRHHKYRCTKCLRQFLVATHFEEHTCAT